MNSRRRLACLIAASAALAAGCSKPEDKFAGHYTGKLTASPEIRAQMAKQYGAEATAKIDELTASMKVDLDLRKDKTYSLTTAGPLGNSKVDGGWSLAQNQVTLTPNGQQAKAAANRPMTLDSDSDAKVLSVRNDKASTSTVTFTRSG